MIHFTPIVTIKVPETRQRQEFDGKAMAELSDSITRIGLLHPIIIEEDGTLYAGERRFRAISNLDMMGQSITFNQKPVPAGTVPCLRYSELDEITRMEIEYDENHKRENLTWQESAKATALLEAIRSKQAEAAGKPTPTISEIAAEIRGSGLGRHATETREALIVAKHLDRPEIAKAKNQKEAVKILRKQEVAQKHAEYAEIIGKSYTTSSHQAINADGMEWLKSCPAESFDLICTDPPYGMGADEFGDSGLGASVHHYSDAWEDVSKTLFTILEQGFRVTKAQAHLYMFCDIDHFHELRGAAETYGWWVFRTPLIWAKLGGGARVPWPEHGPRRSYETILFAVKGKRPVTAIFNDILTYETVGSSSQYAAQKPVALIADLIRRSCRAGDTILDPCMGSGTIFEAATMHKCVATGIEMLAEPYGIAVKRLEELK